MIQGESLLGCGSVAVVTGEGQRQTPAPSPQIYSGCVSNGQISPGAFRRREGGAPSHSERRPRSDASEGGVDAPLAGGDTP